MIDPHEDGILILTTGGTIDKVYFDASSEYEIGEPTVPHILREVGVTLQVEFVSLMRKDSLEMEEADRIEIRRACAEHPAKHILITHGTDTMTETAEALRGLPDKTIVLTGALAPSRFRETDAIFNVGMALGAIQTCAPGVYVAMNGRIFEAGSVRKNRTAGRFESSDRGPACSP